MNTNRIANYMSEAREDSGEVLARSGRGFALNPFGPTSAASWHAQIYQAAFLQAQKEIEEDEDGWPMAEWWN